MTEQRTLAQKIKNILHWRPSRRFFREWTLIHGGAFLVAAGIVYFLVPNNLAAGGVSGLAIVLGAFWPQIPIGFMMLGMNMVLFVAGFLLIGRDFGAKTVYTSFFVSGLAWFLETFFPVPGPLTDDILVQLVFGVLCSAMGMAIVFNQNASTGGTDITAKILHKFFHIDLGKGVLLSDFLIVAGAIAVFGPRIGMYALLGVIMNGILVDWFILGMKVHKYVMIISRESERISTFIIDELESGATIYEARGAYTGEPKDVVSTIVNRRKFIRLRNYIREIDPDAFISVQSIHEVLGEGFSDIRSN
ncbi:MAG: YitT family protein [Thermovirgaceae bacterium]